MMITPQALSALTKLLQFIFSHCPSTPPEMKAMTIGVSPSVVTVRFDGPPIIGKHLSDEVEAFLTGMKDDGAASLHLILFEKGIALVGDYWFDEHSEIHSDVDTREDSAQDGTFIRVNLKEAKKAEKQSVTSLWSALAELVEKMENPPVLSHMSIFLNGERTETISGCQTLAE